MNQKLRERFGIEENGDTSVFARLVKKAMKVQIVQLAQLQNCAITPLRNYGIFR